MTNTSENVPYFDWVMAAKGHPEGWVGLSPTQQAIAHTIALYCDWKTGTSAYPGNENIERVTGLRRETIGRNLDAVVESGWLARVGKRGRVQEYRLAIPEVVRTAPKASTETLERTVPASPSPEQDGGEGSRREGDWSEQQILDAEESRRTGLPVGYFLTIVEEMEGYGDETQEGRRVAMHEVDRCLGPRF